MSKTSLVITIIVFLVVAIYVYVHYFQMSPPPPNAIWSENIAMAQDCESTVAGQTFKEFTQALLDGKHQAASKVEIRCALSQIGYKHFSSDHQGETSYDIVGAFYTSPTFEEPWRLMLTYDSKEALLSADRI